MRTASGRSEGGETLLQCPVCDVYLRKNEGFICPRCKRGPLCRNHRVAGSKECASCVFDAKVKEIGVLRQQENGLKSFLRLLQFFFLVFAVIFIAQKTGAAETIEFLNYSIITEGTETMGALSVCGYVLFYIILYAQRRKIDRMESEMNRSEFRRLVK